MPLNAICFSSILQFHVVCIAKLRHFFKSAYSSILYIVLLLICSYNISTGISAVQRGKERTYRSLCTFDDEFLYGLTQLCLEKRETHLVRDLLIEALYSNNN